MNHTHYNLQTKSDKMKKGKYFTMLILFLLVISSLNVLADGGNTTASATCPPERPIRNSYGGCDPSPQPGQGDQGDEEQLPIDQIAKALQDAAQQAQQAAQQGAQQAAQSAAGAQGCQYGQDPTPTCSASGSICGSTACHQTYNSLWQPESQQCNQGEQQCESNCQASPASCAPPPNADPPVTVTVTCQSGYQGMQGTGTSSGTCSQHSSLKQQAEQQAKEQCKQNVHNQFKQQVESQVKPPAKAQQLQRWTSHSMVLGDGAPTSEQTDCAHRDLPQVKGEIEKLAAQSPEYARNVMSNDALRGVATQLQDTIPVNPATGGANRGQGPGLGQTFAQGAASGAGQTFGQELMKSLMGALQGGDKDGGSGAAVAAIPSSSPNIKESTGAELIRPAGEVTLNSQNAIETNRQQMASVSGGDNYHLSQTDCAGISSDAYTFTNGQTCVTTTSNPERISTDSNGVVYVPLSGNTIAYSNGEIQTNSNPPTATVVAGNPVGNINTAASDVVLQASLYTLAKDGFYLFDFRFRPSERLTIAKGSIISPTLAIEKYFDHVQINFNDISDPTVPDGITVGLFENINKVSGTGYSNIFLPSTRTGNIEAVFPAGYRNDYAVGRTIIINWDNSETLGTYQVKDAKQNIYYIQNGKVVNSDAKTIEDTSPAQLNEVQRARIYGVIQ